uniref:Uncharacterized protein n=1 Tax=Myoviridae sp. ctGrV43 TaxID=2825075 RepID=A0A8S5UEZ9_9CAUD|nr:MAG TPA: hypothetical protein [Myoviridae sp. ctGrV43]DAM92240.1 MAG TPA: hypothetical protein [Caudoviricetes sp.]
MIYQRQNQAGLTIRLCIKTGWLKKENYLYGGTARTGRLLRKYYKHLIPNTYR